MTHHFIMMSGGAGSFAAAKRVLAGKPNHVTLLFCDTMIEDEDLYRFLDDIEAHLGIPITRIADGRTPWQLFNDKRRMGNSQVDLCSRILKRELSDKWLEENCDPLDTVIYVGIDWTESHRFDDGNGRGSKARYSRMGWRCKAPLCEAPYMGKGQMLDLIVEAGIKMPRMYLMGFPHNNCGGFCVKAGFDSFALLLKHFPERYAQHEQAEVDFNRNIGKDKTTYTVMRDRRGKQTRPMSMAKFRRRVETKKFVEGMEWGGCGCFSDD